MLYINVVNYSIVIKENIFYFPFLTVKLLFSLLIFYVLPRNTEINITDLPHSERVIFSRII